ncbi:MAG: Asp-tRNA(Asn)/Glu-tRNA(Gln) amidotransferase subunit GatA [Patescibacteria group bacterium]|nr:Asp-tRNA(Asn)/Glu-tRNA(Gln) amidotransferase subunit GatA [Patescibacteria group bacterium]
MELNQLTIKDAHEGLVRGDYSSRELVQVALDGIKKLEPKLNAFITVSDEAALAQADKADKKIKRGEPLEAVTGLPIGIKDLLVTEGIRTTAGSKILERYQPVYTATAVDRLIKAGAVIVGKTNCDEFGMGASGENSAYGPTKNPWDLRRVPGGSSSGSAAAVASGECLFALGTDTGGSIRQPASFCNLVGLKPTYGRVSRYGLISLASSLDQIGIFTRTIEDCATVLKIIADQDAKDSTSVKKAVPNYPAELESDPPTLRLGVPKEYFVPGMDPEVEQITRTAIKKLTELGFSVEEISLPHTPQALAVYYLILPAEASSNLARYDGIRYGLSVEAGAKTLDDVYKNSREAGFGPEVKRRIMLGTYVLSAGYYDAYYRKAQQVRTLIIEDFQRAFERVDLIITPTSPTPAFTLGEKYEDPLTMYLSDIFTVSANIAGLPGLSLPAGFAKGLPVGIQIMASHFQEDKILALAHAYQKETQYYKQTPKT